MSTAQKPSAPKQLLTKKELIYFLRVLKYIFFKMSAGDSGIVANVFKVSTLEAGESL